MNLNTDFKPADTKSTTIETKPLYENGLLHWYLDSKADTLPQEIIQDMVNGIVNQYNLLDLGKMYRKLVYPSPNSIKLPIRICYDAYDIYCGKYDEPEKQAELEKRERVVRCISS